MVRIKGIQKTSMIDYPGKIATVLFTGHCNMRCPFCQNPDLIHKADELPDLSEDKILEFLKERLDWIDGVCITGGEPLIYPDMPDLIKRIKALGLDVKLDTNGANPDLLKRIIDGKLVDYIALDIKSDPKNYHRAAGIRADIGRIKRSVELIRGSGIPYEFRSTIVPDFFDEEVIRNIAVWLEGSERYYLQQFRSSLPLLDRSFEGKESYTRAKLEEFVGMLAEHIEIVDIRD